MLNSTELVKLIKGEVTSFESNKVKMSAIIAVLEEQSGEVKLTKGTEYRALAHKILFDGGVITLGVTDEMKSKSVYGLFLKRLSDAVDNATKENKGDTEKAPYDAVKRLSAVLKEMKEHPDFSALLKASLCHGE